MKKVIVGIIVGISVAVTATSMAAAEWSHRSRGVWCQSTQSGIACVPLTGEGYGVAISRDAVIVMNINNSKTVFMRQQP